MLLWTYKKVIMDRRSRRVIIWTPVLLAVAVIFGLYLGVRLQKRQQMAYQPYQLSNNSKVGLIMNLIDEHYVDSVDYNKLEETAIPGILKQLDPHTAYIPARDMQGVSEEMSGNFGGIGVQFSIQNDTVMVVDVISGGPSQKLGILAGDRIVMVDDTLIAGVDVSNEDVMHKLRGKKGSKVKVGIARKGFDNLLDFNITRGNIPLYSVDVSYMMDDKTGYIKVSRFAEKTYKEFMESISRLDSQGAENLVIDLRGNPGGYLFAVTKMVNEFLEKGELIVYTEGRTQPRKTYHADKSGSCLDKNVVVMIDEFSASASEIFAGAIQDNDRGLIVGRRSFGKGLVQEQVPFYDGSALRLTVARYYTPAGRCIQKSYENGNEDYYGDIARRYMHGEFEVKDSIEFQDTVKYQTRTGRTVYGGGGIMPDVFVPADTTFFSDYYAKITQKGLVYQFAFNYADTHRATLVELNDARAIEEYLTKRNVMDEFLRFAIEEGIKYNAKGMKQSGKFIETQLMAYISRNIMGEEGFYPIIRHVDTALEEAYKAFDAEQPFMQVARQ